MYLDGFYSPARPVGRAAVVSLYCFVCYCKSFNVLCASGTGGLAAALSEKPCKVTASFPNLQIFQDFFSEGPNNRPDSGVIPSGNIGGLRRPPRFVPESGCKGTHFIQFKPNFPTSFFNLFSRRIADIRHRYLIIRQKPISKKFYRIWRPQILKRNNGIITFA